MERAARGAIPEGPRSRRITGAKPCPESIREHRAAGMSAGLLREEAGDRAGRHGTRQHDVKRYYQPLQNLPGQSRFSAGTLKSNFFTSLRKAARWSLIRSNTFSPCSSFDRSGLPMVAVSEYS